MKNPKKPELVAGAGNWATLIAAVESGADSVYFGIKGINMRNSAKNFDLSELKKIITFLHKSNCRGYLALNVIIMNNEITKVKKILQVAKKSGVDGVILWDMSVLSLAREIGLPIHISTQASVSNIESLRFFSSAGAKRVVLARECSLKSIKAICKEIVTKEIDCKVEAFVHGAMCVSISGRCFMSYDTHRKSANRGECLQPCRREFYIKDTENQSEYILGQDYVMSPKDLCSIDFLDKLIKSGINSFKIEGRMRSAEYMRVATSAYREAIDLFFDKKFDTLAKNRLKEKLCTVYNRGFSSGFYFDDPVVERSQELENTYEKVFIGEVLRFFKKINVAEVIVRNNSLKCGDEVLFIGNSTPARQTIISELESNHQPVKKADKGTRVGVKLPFTVKPKDKVFLWKKRA